MNVLRGQNRLVLGGSLHWILPDRLDTYRQTCRTFTEFKDNIFLARSNNKCMLVLKDDGNLYHYQQENQKFLQLNISSMDFNKVLSMTIDSNNLLWIFATGNNTRCYRLNHTGKSVTLIPEKPFGHHGLKHAFIGEDSAYFIDETYALYEYSFSNRQCYYIADLKDEIENEVKYLPSSNEKMTSVSVSKAAA